MTPKPDNEVRRRLGLPSAAALVVGNMIGAGVFTTSGFALADLGRRELVLAAWVVAGIIAMFGALSYGALARRMPESGGEYYFLYHTVHPLAGFLAGWVSLLVGFTAPIAAAALGLQAYLAPLVGSGVRPEWIGTTAILVAGLLHGLRLAHGVRVQNVAIVLKLLLITGFIVVGIRHAPQAAQPVRLADFELGPFAVSLVWISFSYCGWNAAVYIASEVRSPERNLNRSLWLGTAVVTVVYLALNAVFLYSAPIEDLAGKKEIAAIAARALGGETLQSAVSLLVALALFTSISAMVMAGPRVYARMAEDGLFPRVFAMRGDVPAPAVALQTALAIVVVWISDLKELLGYIGFTLGLSAAATVAGLIALRRREGAESVPVPGYPWIPGLFVVATLGATGFMAVREFTVEGRPREAAVGLLTIAAGVPVYWWMRRRSKTGE